MLPSGGTCVIQSLRQSDAGVFTVCISRPTQNNIGITWKLSGRSPWMQWMLLLAVGLHWKKSGKTNMCLRPLTVQFFRSIAECCLNNTYLFSQQHENSFISQLKVGCKVADSRIQLLRALDRKVGTYVLRMQVPIAILYYSIRIFNPSIRLLFAYTCKFEQLILFQNKPNI